MMFMFCKYRSSTSPFIAHRHLFIHQYLSAAEPERFSAFNNLVIIRIPSWAKCRNLTIFEVRSLTDPLKKAMWIPVPQYSHIETAKGNGDVDPFPSVFPYIEGIAMAVPSSCSKIDISLTLAVQTGPVPHLLMAMLSRTC